MKHKWRNRTMTADIKLLTDAAAIRDMGRIWNYQKQLRNTNTRTHTVAKTRWRLHTKYERSNGTMDTMGQTTRLHTHRPRTAGNIIHLRKHIGKHTPITRMPRKVARRDTHPELQHTSISNANTRTIRTSYNSHATPSNTPNGNRKLHV